MAIEGAKGLAVKHLTVLLADVSTASIVYLRMPERGKIQKIRTTLQAAITVAAAAITFEINGEEILGSEIEVLHTDSAPGDMDESVPTGLNDVEEGDLLEIISDGGSTTAAGLLVTIELNTAP